MPVLCIQLSVLVITFIVLFIIRQVLATRKAVEPYQRIHIKASRYGFILHRLLHDIHVTVQFQPAVEEDGGLSQIDIVFGEFIFIQNAATGGVGIGEICLQLVISGVDGYRSDRRQSGTEKVTQIIVNRQIFFFSPTVCYIIYSVAVLHFGQRESLFKSQSGREMNIPPSYGISFLCSNKNDSVGRLATIQGCGRSSFQDADTFHVLRIQIRDAVASVPVAGICRTADSRISLFRSRI